MVVHPNDAIVRKQVKSVEFGFYTDDDVRKRSVVEITSYQSFDSMTSQPLPNGLYDPRLGIDNSRANANSVPCVTCSLPYQYCPGHFGHIELAVPCYHPMLLKEIMSVLACKCMNCHAMKGPKRSVQIFKAKLQLLYNYNYSSSNTGTSRQPEWTPKQALDTLLQLDDEMAVAERRGLEDFLRDLETEKLTQTQLKRATAHQKAAAKDGVLQKYSPKERTSTATENKDRHSFWTSYHKQLRRQLIQEFVAEFGNKKHPCPKCGHWAPRFRADASNKLFLSYSKLANTKNKEAETKLSLMSARGDQAKGRNQSTGYDSEDTEPEEDSDDDESGDDDDDEMDGEDDDDDEDEEDDGAKSTKEKLINPDQVKFQLQCVWEKEPFVCNALFGTPSFDIMGYKKFFVQAIPVPPTRFRPAMELNGMSVEHGQTQYLARILRLNETLRSQFVRTTTPVRTPEGDEVTADELSRTKGRAFSTWIDLQTAVNSFMDSSKDPSATPSAQVTPGIRQYLEKKEGLFRKNMMGKRVDYACRSVISPDPYIGTNEIGLPLYFAQVLTYPTPVTDLNIREMRQLVERGPHNYPGARWVSLGVGGRKVELSKMNRHKREAVAAKLLANLKNGGQPAIVGRQLRNGDYVLMNRQPTLHKPGIMAHKVRILHSPTQKTIRMHYANCNTYNADYDGDEMNCHFPQSDLGRSEAKCIARTDLQYIVPTDGSPLRGLIQDHVVGGVKLTKKDTFLEKWEYQQLLFAAIASLDGLEMIPSDMNIELLPPAILKPKELWTGKQVISTLLNHLRKGQDDDSEERSVLPGLSTERKSKTPEAAFGPKQEEHLVLIRDGELLRGVLDKAAFGSTDFSLVHATYEAYGPQKAGLLLNSLGRLFTAYIQYYSGHSCRVEDLVLTQEADRQRRALVQRAYNIGSRAAKIWADSDGGKVAMESVMDTPGFDTPLKPVEAAAVSSKIGHLLSGEEGKENFAALDSYMQGQLNPLASDIVKKSLPGGLAVPFPFNTFGVMTMTGAKGSIVNQSQVTCALGQQALEGRRVPRLSSGRTLPSFAPYDPNPRADGFVLDRFLTGIRPQEYYFHCMAGREGLVDTAVKTSRSGYLQRCLVKHLEELKICYDHTVRNAEGGVVQFLYGEDGLDPTKASYLDCSDRSFEFMASNFEAVQRLNSALPHSSIDKAARDASKYAAITGGGVRFPYVGQQVKARRLRAGHEWKRGALFKGWHEALVTKVRENGKAVDLKYLADGETARKVPVEANLGRCGSSMTRAESSLATIVAPAVGDPILSSIEGGHRLGSSGSCVSERVASSATQSMKSSVVAKTMSRCGVTEQSLSSLIGAKYSSSLCPPGEAVGSIAAQSVGEPSTQMTLNTFHLAGSGANVTLGIPRLREIIMTASRELSTPTMSVPLRKSVSEKQALRLTRDFTKLSLMELLSGYQGIRVRETLEESSDSGEWVRAYHVSLKFHPEERIRDAFGLSLRDIARVVENDYTKLLKSYADYELRRTSQEKVEFSGKTTLNAENDDGDESGDDAEAKGDSRKQVDDFDDDDDDDEGDEDEPTEEDGAATMKNRRRAPSISYDDDDENDDTEEKSGSSESDGSSDSDDQEDTSPNQTRAPTTQSKSDKASVRKGHDTIDLPVIELNPATPPLLIVGLAERAAQNTLVRSRTKNIQQAFLNREKNGTTVFNTLGVNFAEIWKLSDEIVDHNGLVSNDIWAVCNAYGVEAARCTIVEQITSVFGAYGITVDPRHLSLIADYMTFEGGYKAMNRIGMNASSSPLLQMSFETTCTFLMQAALANEADHLTSPSGNIVLGKPVEHGTGSFALLASTGED